MQQNNIRVYSTPEELTVAAAGFIVSLANDSVRHHGRFIISLSGGHTPEHLFTLLATPEYIDSIPWKDTFVFWGDERCVPLNDKDNNARMAINTLLSKVDIPSDNIMRIPSDKPPGEAATTYEQTLIDFFGDEEPVFDLILLGLGENGHTASLFPGTDVLKEQYRWIKEVYVEEQKMYRITMTYTLINMARNVAFLVEGGSKADILSQVLDDTNDNKYPAQLIKPTTGHLYWLVDSKAAAKLPGGKV